MQGINHDICKYHKGKGKHPGKKINKMPELLNLLLAPVQSAAAMLKLLGSKWCCEICDECIQVLGGNGYSREFHVERLYRDAKLLEIGEGTSEIQRVVISGAVLAK